jgi:hypothetical protein
MNRILPVAAILASSISLLGCDTDSSDNAPDSTTALEAGEVEHQLSDIIPESSTIIAEVTSPGGSVVAFIQDDDGSIGMLEHGMEGSRAVGSLPELENATPLEIFTALTPSERQIPAALVADHESTITLVPDEPRIDESFDITALEGFAPDENGRRWYSSCTNISGWQNAQNGASVGPNCKDGVGGTCITNVTNDFHGCHPGGGCYLKNWRPRSRWSTCNKGGGTYEARLVRYQNGGYQALVDVDTTSAGAYYYYWRYAPGSNQRWSMSRRRLSGSPNGHFSLWASY